MRVISGFSANVVFLSLASFEYPDTTITTHKIQQFPFLNPPLNILVILRYLVSNRDPNDPTNIPSRSSI
jgi:hypothetical protein